LPTVTPDRSIAACSKVLARSSSLARAAAFHNLVSLEPMEEVAAYMTVADIAQQARRSVLPIICRK
jgi:hypothetical protein